MYSQPIGDHGHGAGPLLVLPSTWCSSELQATTPVPEWDGQEPRSAQEEDVTIDASGRVEWILERQTRYHVVR